jgi:hypothetical protein
VRRAHAIGHYADWLRGAREHRLSEGLTVAVAAPNDILRSKEAAGREKDRAATAADAPGLPGRRRAVRPALFALRRPPGSAIAASRDFFCVCASFASAMERVMIQADRALLERARRAARERGVTFPQLVRDALEHELGAREGAPRPLSSVGAVSTGGRARARAYEPDAWR